MIKLLQSICHLLEEGEDLVLATVIGHSGSTPRSVGTKMVVRPSGAIIGTIGGGLVEFHAQKLAREVFRTGKALTETVEFTGADAAATDQMICGGRMEILLELILADPENLKELQDLIVALQKGHKGYLIKTLDTTGAEVRRMEWCLVHNDSVTLGTLPCLPSLIACLTGEAAKAKQPVAVTVEEKRFFVEPTVLPGTVYLFGAGHVSRPVAELASIVDFQTVVVDDRAEFANTERFPRADQLKVVPSFSQAFDGLEIDRDSYVVIVTRGHLHDKTVLELALKSNAGYIGMIGSRRKRDLIYQELLSKGFSQSDLERVHAPIGLAIGAETPEEIGVSIVSELIQVRAGRGE
ncbi:MAG: XdhC family aldehyde oxidoreductase maturation factor [Geobacteraceae bacterium]|jgi:xanthine dehydrogenase accessory factor